MAGTVLLAYYFECTDTFQVHIQGFFCQDGDLMKPYPGTEEESFITPLVLYCVLAATPTAIVSTEIDFSFYHQILNIFCLPFSSFLYPWAFTISDMSCFSQNRVSRALHKISFKWALSFINGFCFFVSEFKYIYRFFFKKKSMFECVHQQAWLAAMLRIATVLLKINAVLVLCSEVVLNGNAGLDIKTQIRVE